MTETSSHRPVPLVAGNWKMNGLLASVSEIARLRDGLSAGTVDVVVCPPATLVVTVAEAVRGSVIEVGGQDCHGAEAGAHTGDISAAMLRDAGATFVIVGHSERRSQYGETDAVVRAKAERAHAAGLIAIVCVGETAEERRDGSTLDVVERQLSGSVPDLTTAGNTVIAYEPVWAIGTGLTPTPADVVEVHAHLRAHLDRRFGARAQGLRLLYGGSVKPANARELLCLSNVDGALVGGASLKADDFLGIISTYRS